jgi:hypothetical protein
VQTLSAAKLVTLGVFCQALVFFCPDKHENGRATGVLQQHKPLLQNDRHGFVVLSEAKDPFNQTPEISLAGLRAWLVAQQGFFSGKVRRFRTTNSLLSC